MSESAADQPPTHPTLQALDTGTSSNLEIRGRGQGEAGQWSPGCRLRAFWRKVFHDFPELEASLQARDFTGEQSRKRGRPGVRGQPVPGAEPGFRLARTGEVKARPRGRDRKVGKQAGSHLHPLRTKRERRGGRHKVSPHQRLSPRGWVLWVL